MRRHLRIENVLATLALFAAVGGGTAMALPGKRTVQANDLRKNSVKAAAIAKNAVRAAEIKANAVRSGEIMDGAVTGADVADGGLGYEDLGSNSVVARIRSAGPTETGDGGAVNPVDVPLTGDQWTQAANEIDVFFGEMTITGPATCDGMFSEMVVEVLVDGERIDSIFVDTDAPNETLSGPIVTERSFLFEPGTATPRDATVRIHDTCTGAGQDFRLDEIAVNAVAIR